MEELPFSPKTDWFPSSSSSRGCTGRLRWLVSALAFPVAGRTNCVVVRGYGVAIEVDLHAIRRHL